MEDTICSMYKKLNRLNVEQQELFRQIWMNNAEICGFHSRFQLCSICDYIRFFSLGQCDGTGICPSHPANIFLAKHNTHFISTQSMQASSI